MLLNPRCPGSASGQLIPQEHQLEAQPVLSRSIVVVGPNGVTTGFQIVFQKECVPSGFQGFHQVGILELLLKHMAHGCPIATVSGIAPIFQTLQLLLLCESFLSRQVLKFSTSCPKFQRLKGCFRILEGHYLATGRTDFQLPWKEICQESSLATLVDRRRIAWEVETDDSSALHWTFKKGNGLGRGDADASFKGFWS
eukprot:Skav232115  [mRNA]  locus=scaffold2353:132096:141368:- [translate_table: standard]